MREFLADQLTPRSSNQAADERHQFAPSHLHSPSWTTLLRQDSADPSRW
jgi:hypothetical protein